MMMEDHLMSYTCEAIERPEQATLSIRTRAAEENLPATVGKAYGAIMQYLGEIGAAPVGAPFVVYYNMDMQDLDMEIGFPVAHKIDGKGDIQPRIIPAGRYAACLFTGPYDKLASAYQGLTAFVAENGYQAEGISYEFYLNDPGTTPPEQLQTHILFPLNP